MTDLTAATDLTAPAGAMPSLQRKFEGRALRSLILTTLVWGGALLASVPLISVLYMLITRGEIGRAHV